MLVTDCGIRNAAERTHLLPRFVIWLVKMWCFRVGIILPLIFPPHAMALHVPDKRCIADFQRNNRQLIPFSAQIRNFHAQLLILIVKSLQSCQKESTLSMGIIVAMRDCRTVVRRYPTNSPVKEAYWAIGRDVSQRSKSLKLAFEIINRWPRQNSCFKNLLLPHTNSEEMQIVVQEGGQIYLCKKEKYN